MRLELEWGSGVRDEHMKPADSGNLIWSDAFMQTCEFKVNLWKYFHITGEGAFMKNCRLSSIAGINKVGFFPPHFINCKSTWNVFYFSETLSEGRHLSTQSKWTIVWTTAGTVKKIRAALYVQGYTGQLTRRSATAQMSVYTGGPEHGDSRDARLKSGLLLSSRQTDRVEIRFDHQAWWKQLINCGQPQLCVTERES